MSKDLKPEVLPKQDEMNAAAIEMANGLSSWARRSVLGFRLSDNVLEQSSLGECSSLALPSRLERNQNGDGRSTRTEAWYVRRGWISASPGSLLDGSAVHATWSSCVI